MARTPVTGLVVTDMDGVVRSWSSGATDLFGFSADEAVGRRVGDFLIPPPLREEHLAAVQRYREGGPARRVGTTADVPACHRDGTTSVVEMSLIAIQLDTEPLLVAVFRRPDHRHREPDIPSLELLTEIFERAPEVITLLDAAGRQRTVNAAGARMMGYGPDSRHPGDGYPLIHPDDREAVRAAADSIRGTGRALEVPVRYRVLAGHGRYRWLETLAADFSDRPELGGLVAFSRDVTDDEERRQRLGESEARLRAIISTLHVANVVEDADRRIILANSRFADLVSHHREAASLSGSPIEPLLERLCERAVDTVDLHGRLRRAAQADHLADMPAVPLRDGRWIDIECVVIRGPADVVGRFWLFRDVTERVESEHRLRRVLEHEQQARELAEQVANELVRLDEARLAFVSTVSHEFRTPLSTILAAAELLDGAPPGDGDALHRYLDLITRNAQRLARLVDDLLVIGRLGSGRLTLDLADVDLAEVIADVVEGLTPWADAAEVRLLVDVSPGPRLRADELRLHQVVENVVGNAIKYSGDGATATVTASCDGEIWTIRVVDDGPGISAEEALLVFEPYYRSRNPVDGQQPGSGLGLAIVRGLVELHGGTVDVERPGEPGARIVCRLPVAGPRAH